MSDLPKHSLLDKLALLTDHSKSYISKCCISILLSELNVLGLFRLLITHDSF